MQFAIKNLRTGKVQFTAEIECDEDTPLSIKIGLAVKWAIKARANLAGANLAGADLARANLADAYLTGANLTRANLTDAYLAGADLAGAYLAGADLADAYLTGANLTRANLTRANLTDAYLTGANLTRANLTRANLAGANQELLDVPVVPKIDQLILSAIDAGGTLNMGSWHGPEGWCGTTHCRAGWAVHLAGEKGKALEDRIGTQRAGAMIYRASRPGKPAPWFFGPNDEAMEDIRKCAAEQSVE